MSLCRSIVQSNQSVIAFSVSVFVHVDHVSVQTIYHATGGRRNARFTRAKSPRKLRKETREALFPVNFYTIVSLSLVINFAVRYSSNGITKYYASNYFTILDSGDTSIDYFKRAGKLRESESKDSRVKALIIS